MSFRFVTVRRSDPDFDSYITGAFSNSERAVPMGSLNIRSRSDFVTFKIIPADEEKPTRARIVWEGLRPRLLTITVAPAALSLMIMARQNMPIDGFLAATSLLGLVFLHLSVFLLNDFFDHYRGRDQINRSRGSRIIQKGWATAKAVRFWGFFNLVVGVLLGLPALFQKPLVVGGIGGLAVLIILGYSNMKQGLRDTGIGEILVSFCLGPMLVMGYGLAVSDSVSPSALAMGIIFGWMASLIFQLKNLEEMVTTYQNRNRTLIQRLGFDRGKKFISLQLYSMPFVALAIFQLVPMSLLLSVCALVLFFTCYWLARRIGHADSPMSSVLAGVADQMAILHLKNAIFFSILLFPPIV